MVSAWYQYDVSMVSVCDEGSTNMSDDIIMDFFYSSMIRAGNWHGISMVLASIRTIRHGDSTSHDKVTCHDICHGNSNDYG